jgi:putative transposase
VDLGVSTLATFTIGGKVAAPKHLHHSLRKLARLVREKSRRKLGSRNRAKTKARIARVHERVKCDWLRHR